MTRVITLALLLVLPPQVSVRRAPEPGTVNFLLKSQIPAASTAKYYQRMPSNGEACEALYTASNCPLSSNGMYRICADKFIIKNNPRGIRLVTLGTYVPGGPSAWVPGPWIMEADVWCSTVLPGPDNCPMNLFPTYGASTAMVPGSLTAVAVSATQIKLSWVDTTFGERGFAIERSSNGVSGWTVIGYAGPGVTVFNDCFLQCGTTYYYRVYTLGT